MKKSNNIKWLSLLSILGLLGLFAACAGDGTTGGASSFAAERSTGECVESSECQSGEYCWNGTCGDDKIAKAGTLCSSTTPCGKGQHHKSYLSKDGCECIDNFKAGAYGCLSNEQCASGSCYLSGSTEYGICYLGYGKQCTADGDCLSNKCGPEADLNPTCQKSDSNGLCLKDSDCESASLICSGNKCVDPDAPVISN